MIIVRYADAFVLGFENRAEAERFRRDLGQRLERFGLSLNPDKTRLIEFGRHAAARRRRRGMMKAHGLIERVGKQYRYRLTDKGVRVCLMFTLFHKRVCGPLAGSLFNRPPNPDLKPSTKLEAAYRRADRCVDKTLTLPAA